MSSPESSTIIVKARPMLSDMPYKIKVSIAENTDFKTRYTLRKVSTHFRAAVDTSKFNFEFVKVEVYRDFINMCVDWVNNIVYRKNGEHGCVVIKYRNGRGKIIEGENFIQKAVDDLGIILKSPKVSGIRMWLENSRDEDTNVRMMHCLQEKLGSFRHKLSIRELAADLYRKQDQVLQLLGLLKPGILISLKLKGLRENCDRIVETEHWPLLEVAHVGDVEGVPISKFLHLKSFRMGAFPLTKDVVEEIVQSILQRPENFDCYDFFTNNIDMNQLWREALSDYWPARPKIPIPGTDHHLEIQHYEYRMIKFECMKNREVERILFLNR